mgnify:CR=1 FL=1
MLTHIVLVRFDNMADAEEGARQLRAMKGRIPSMTDVEAGVDITRSGRSYELALITRHPDQAGLDAYQTHPVHQEVLVFLRAKSSGSVSVDFES